MDLKWEDGFTIKVDTEHGEVVIAANKEGLISLANHLMCLAKEAPGSHIHLDEHNSLEEGSAELILVRIE